MFKKLKSVTKAMLVALKASEDDSDVKSEIPDTPDTPDMPEDEVKLKILDCAPDLFKGLYVILVYHNEEKFSALDYLQCIRCSLSGIYSKACRNRKQPLSNEAIVDTLISKFAKYEDMQEIIDTATKYFGEIEVENKESYFKNIYQQIVDILPGLIRYSNDLKSVLSLKGIETYILSRQINFEPYIEMEMAKNGYN